MKKLFGILLLCCFWTATPSLAASQSQFKLKCDSNDPNAYPIADHDVLYLLSGLRLKDPEQWRTVVDKNPCLQEKGRVEQKDGKEYAWIFPGERLVGLQEAGFLPQATEFQMPTPQKVEVVREIMPVWGWVGIGLPLLLLLLAALAYAISRRIIRQNPVTSRPAVVEGGVNAQTAGTTFQRRAARTYNAAMGTTAAPQAFTILEQTRGRGFGVLLVEYGDGKLLPRELDGENGEGEVVWKTRIRRPNGTEEEMYMLERCGNPVLSGRILRWLPGDRFRFVPDQVVAAQPVPAAAAEVPAQIQEPAPEATEPAAANTPVAANGKVAPVSIDFKRSKDGRPHQVRLHGRALGEFMFTAEEDGESVSIRFGSDTGSAIQQPAE